MTLPLEGIRVVDLTRARAGPTAVRQLADMGADVVKVEAREEVEGDSTALGFDFLNLHRNKRSITLDLKHPRAIEVLKRLVSQADVVIENFRPDVKRRLDSASEAMPSRRPTSGGRRAGRESSSRPRRTSADKDGPGSGGTRA